MPYRPDPAGVFASDVHRRVLAALPTKFEADFAYLIEPVLADENTPLYTHDQDTYAAFHHILTDLEVAGYVERDGGDKARRTEAGSEALAADVAYEVLPKLTDEQIAEREAENAAKAVQDAARAAESRLVANEVALEEIADAIAEDKATIEAAA